MPFCCKTIREARRTQNKKVFEELKTETETEGERLHVQREKERKLHV